MRLADGLGLAGLSLAYAIPVALHWNLGHLDFGDGNYMYISWRMAQGEMLYRDILAPQPPLHLIIGAALARLGEFTSHQIYAFRLFSLLLHVITLFLLHNTALHIAKLCMPDRSAHLAAWLAGAIWLLCPIGFWWTLGFQTQPLLMFLLLAVFRLLLAGNRSGLIAAGFVGAAAWHTNMTGAPYVLTYGLWLAVRNPRAALYYWVPLLAAFGSGAAAAQIITGNYFENVILNQAGAYPPGRFVSYATGKLLNQGSNILRLEGPIALAGLLGVLTLASRLVGTARDLVLLATLLATGCVVFMTKGGTVDYVFTLAEPYLALGSALGGVLAWPKVAELFRRRTTWDPTPLFAIGIAAFVFITLFMVPLQYIKTTLAQRNYELDERETLRLVDMLKRNVPPEATTLAPPHYAFIAERKLEQNYSEHFLWQLKYWNERTNNQTGHGVITINKIARALQEKKIPFLIMDENQTGNIPEIKEALQMHYLPQQAKPYETANTPLQFYRPK